MRIRDREAFWLFTIGIGLSIFIMLNGYQLLNGWTNQMLKKQDESGYTNAAVLEFNFYNEDTEDDFWDKEQVQNRKERVQKLLQLLSEQEAVTYIDNLVVQIGQSNEAHGINIVMSGQEEWYRSLENGQYASGGENSIPEGQVFLTESAKKYAEQIENVEVLRVYGEYLPVEGVFRSYDITGADEEITIGYTASLEQVLCKRMSEGTMKICIGSNQQDIQETVKSIQTEMMEILGTDVEVVDYTGDAETARIQKLYLKIRGYMLAITFAVSLLNCWQIARFWVERKHRELAIMQTFGMSVLQIMWYLIQELLVNVLAAACIAGVLEIFYCILTKRQWVDIRIGLINTRWLLLAFFIILIITLTPTGIRVWRSTPLKGIKGK